MKLFMKIMPIVMMVMLVGTSVFGIAPTIPNAGGSQITGVTDLAGSVWKTAQIIIQIAAIAAIILAGVRYMFASADAKADIKQQTVILVVGAILVFAAVPIANFISKLGTQIFK